MTNVIVTTSPVATCVLNQDGEVIEIFPEITIQLYNSLRGVDQILTDSQFLHDLLDQQGIRSTIKVDNPILKDWRFNRYQKLLNQAGLVSNYDEYYQKMREGALEHSFEKIKEHSGKKDELIAQTVHAIDDLQKVINLSGNRLMELYALHFPELVDTINNQVTLAKIIADEPRRSEMTPEMFQKIALPSEKIEFIMEKKGNSLGGDLDLEELEAMQEYAHSLIQTQERRLSMEKWIDRHMEKLAPNLTAVAGSNVGARLISAMGSLMNLAKTHASKIQIIGAEKALYSSLKGRGTTPKHGIIFQIPEIGNAPYYIRGKLARSFANQIAIAARLDAFDGEFLGEKMRTELRELEAKLREERS